MSDDELEPYRETIAFWASLRASCPDCPTRGWFERDDSAGWEPLDDRNGEIKRCADHGLLYPWAGQLDPAKVREYHREHGDNGAYVVDFELLRTTCML
jgi:hypothetical protein